MTLFYGKISQIHYFCLIIVSNGIQIKVYATRVTQNMKMREILWQIKKKKNVPYLETNDSFDVTA